MFNRRLLGKRPDQRDQPWGLQEHQFAVPVVVHKSAERLGPDGNAWMQSVGPVELDRAAGGFHTLDVTVERTGRRNGKPNRAADPLWALVGPAVTQQLVQNGRQRCNLGGIEAVEERRFAVELC